MFENNTIDLEKRIEQNIKENEGLTLDSPSSSDTKNSFENTTIKKIGKNSFKVVYDDYNKTLFQLLEHYYIFPLRGNVFFVDGSDEKHDKESIKTKRLIYVDLDPIDKESTYYGLKDKMLEIAKELKAFGLIFTGRGYHFYFMLDKNIKISYIKKLYSHIVEYFQNKVRDKLVEYNLDMFNIDNASKSYNQPIRLPGSINPKNGYKVTWLYQNKFNLFSFYELTGVEIIDKDDIDKELLDILKDTFKDLVKTKISSIDSFFDRNMFEKVINIASKKTYGYTQDLSKNFKCVLHEENNPSATLSKINNQYRYCDYHIESKNKSIIPTHFGKFKNILEFMVSYVLNKNILLTKDAKKELLFAIIDYFNIENTQYDRKKEIVTEKIDILVSLLKNSFKRKQLERTLIALKTVIIEKLNQGNTDFILSQKWLSQINQTTGSETSKLLNLLTAVGILKRTNIYVIVNGEYKEISFDEYEEKYNGKYYTYKYEFNYNFDPYKKSEELIVFLKNHKIKYITVNLLISVFSKYKSYIKTLRNSPIWDINTYNTNRNYKEIPKRNYRSSISLEYNFNTVINNIYVLLHPNIYKEIKYRIESFSKSPT